MMADPRLPSPFARLDHDEIEPQRQPRDQATVRQRPTLQQAVRRRRGRGCACGGRPSPRAARSRATRASGPRRSTSAAGGPGSTATRSSSWRPTWTFRARTVQPASTSRSSDQALGGVAGPLGRGPDRVGLDGSIARIVAGDRSSATYREDCTAAYQA